ACRVSVPAVAGGEASVVVDRHVVAGVGGGGHDWYLLDQISRGSCRALAWPRRCRGCRGRGAGRASTRAGRPACRGGSGGTAATAGGRTGRGNARPAA